MQVFSLRPMRREDMTSTMTTATAVPTRRALAAVTAVALAVTSAGFAASQPVEAQTPARSEVAASASVSVDFGARHGELPRSERFNNFGNVTAWPAQRSDDVAFLNEQGLHGDVYRVWLASPNAPAEENVLNQCDLATSTCDFSPTIEAYLTDASTVSDSILVNIGPPDAFVRGQRPLEELRPLLELVLRNLKAQYPAIGYVEAFNEPDWNYHGQFVRGGRPELVAVQPGDLYRLYVPFYEAVDAVNQSRPRGGRLLVGGPALMSMDPRWMEPFLDDFAADTNPRKHLDFLSYHAYLSWDEGYQVPTMYKGDLSVVASERATIAGWLRERRIRRHIPSFVTETGIYPGPSFDDTNPANDYIRQAAGLATYSYLYGNQPDTVMFNWCVRHRVEERKDQLVTRTPNGPVTDTFTPYGNMLLMQSMMKDTRVSAVSDTPLIDGDNGVYATASTDRTGASVMVWNWQHIHDQTYQTTIDMSRLPGRLRHGPVRQRLYRVDQTTSNHFADPATADLQLIGEEVVTLGRTHGVTIDLGPNAIYLVTLEPV
jgi:hypothetical protein